MWPLRQPNGDATLSALLGAQPTEGFLMATFPYNQKTGRALYEKVRWGEEDAAADC